jgi:hypothetical protein
MLELDAERIKGGEPERLRLGVGTNGLDIGEEEMLGNDGALGCRSSPSGRWK